MGLVKPDTITKALTDKPMLIQKQYSVEEIEGLQKCFVLYVKMDKKRWKDIQRAEADTPEGNRIFEELRREYLDSTPAAAGIENSEQSNVPDLEYGLEKSGASKIEKCWPHQEWVYITTIYFNWHYVDIPKKPISKTIIKVIEV